MRKKKKQDGFQIMSLIVCVAAGLVCLYPMYYVFIMSISNPREAVQGVYFWPKGFYLESYITVFKDSEVWRGLLMSLFYVVTGTAGMVVMCVLAAYPLTRRNLAGRRLVVFYLLVPMYFGGGMIPSYLNMVDLGLYNTVWSLILPSWISIWNIILVRTFFMSIPNELEEAAFIDGASHFKVMTRVCVPLAKPVLAVVAIYTIVGIWNSWFPASIYITNYNLHPVQLYLRRILVGQANLVKDMIEKGGAVGVDEMERLVLATLSSNQIKYAVIIVVSLPIIAVYPIFQKHFVKGVMLGSLKG